MVPGDEGAQVDRVAQIPGDQPDLVELAGVVEGERGQRLGRRLVVHQHQPPAQLDEIVRGALHPGVAGGVVGGDPAGQRRQPRGAGLAQERLADQRLHRDASPHVLVGGRGDIQEQLAGDQLAGGAEGRIFPSPLADQGADLARAEAAEPPQVLLRRQATQRAIRLLAPQFRHPRPGAAGAETGRLRQAAEAGHEIR